MFRINILFLIFFFYFTFSYSSAISLEVPERSSECFFEDIKIGKWIMDFEVIRGGLLDIDVIIYDPFESIIFRKRAFFNHKEASDNKREGHIEFTSSKTGAYRICFDNQESKWVAKTVSFVTYGDSIGIDAPESHNLAQIEHLSPLVDSILTIQERLEDITKLQHYLRIRESIHRDTQESTNTRVAWMTIIESIVLLLLSVLQLYFIRKWFDFNQIKV